MKTFLIGIGATVLVALARSAGAQMMLGYGPPGSYGAPYAAPAYPYGYPTWGYGVYPYYPYPLPPAPSLNFGRGGIYGHVFVPRSERIWGYTLPGGAEQPPGG